MANEYLLSFNKIGHLMILTQTPMIEPSAGHLFRPATDHAVVVRKVFILAVYFTCVTLDHTNVPTCR